jgi:AcrR family transcriptional regulator
MNTTKQRIVDTAERLFNESGTGAVSTNHIAAAMGISPGNLYYHFGNKDEIVLVALDRLAAAIDLAWSSPDGADPDVDRLEQGLAGTLAALDEHRFAAREVYSLGLHSEAVRNRCQRLVLLLADHLGAALGPLGDDPIPESGPNSTPSAWVCPLVSMVLSWGSLCELCVPDERGARGQGAGALARALRAGYRGIDGPERDLSLGGFGSRD